MYISYRKYWYLVKFYPGPKVAKVINFKIQRRAILILSSSHENVPAIDDDTNAASATMPPLPLIWCECCTSCHDVAAAVTVMLSPWCCHCHCHWYANVANTTNAMMLTWYCYCCHCDAAMIWCQCHYFHDTAAAAVTFTAMILPLLLSISPPWHHHWWFQPW